METLPMTEYVVEEPVEIEKPDISHLITEDDAPVDNIFSAKQQRLLVEPLYSSWHPLDDQGRPSLFLADANIGVYRSVNTSPVVPDVFLSLDVQVAEDWFAKEHRSYLLWEFGKPPEVVIEIVSNKKGAERGKKFREYARLGAWYYVIYDPQQLLQNQTLAVYEFSFGEYIPRADTRLEKIGLSLVLWTGAFENKETEWLRWADLDGGILLTGAEMAKRERARAERERTRAERLTAQLRALGVEPEA